MRFIDTDALRLVARALGIGNPATATEQVEFDDGNLQQMLDVSSLVRRASGPGIIPGGGVYSFELGQLHAGIGTITDDYDPYDLSTYAGAPGAQYPTQDELDHMDIWLAGPLSFQGNNNNVVTSQLNLEMPAELSSGMDNAGQEDLLIAGTIGGLILTSYYPLVNSIGSGVVCWPFLRIPRGANLEFTTQTTGALTITVSGCLIIVPAGMDPEPRTAGSW